MGNSKASSMGGIARAEKLSSSERTRIAQEAAAKRWGIPKATHDGTIRFGDVSIPCAVLEDGTRVLTQKGVQRALGRSNQMGARDESGGEQLPSFLRSKAIKPYISEELSAASRPIVFIQKHGGKAFGFKAEILPLVCDAFLRAREEDALAPNQMATARQCEMLVRSLAKVGIVALVDEATGYQEIRDRHALQAILDQYLKKEFAAWAKRFPDEFYKEIFRLKKWEWMGMSKNRPSCVAAYTKDVVYERLAPGILEELEKKNPVLESGSRKAKHHQWLTEDIGHPALSQHIHTVVALMRGCSGWESFKNLIDKSLPRKNATQLMPFVE